MTFSYQEISFDEIFPIWNNDLWPNRVSKIESHSAMVYLSDKFSMEQFTLPAWYFGVFNNGELLGVNSGHMCSDGSARSRGLWVSPDRRGHGHGLALLNMTSDRASVAGATAVWSYPRRTSWTTYRAAGFQLMSDWEESETSEANAYCKLDL